MSTNPSWIPNNFPGLDPKPEQKIVMAFRRYAQRIEADEKTVSDLQTQVNALPTTLPHNTAYSQFATATLVLTNAYQDVPGVTITLVEAGNYFISATVDMNYRAADGNLLAQLMVNGVAQPGLIIDSGPSDELTLCRTWIKTSIGAGQIIKIQAKKVAGAAASFIGQADTSLIAVLLV